MTDTVGDEHLSLGEKNRFIVAAAAETIDALISSGLSEQTALEHEFTTATGAVDMANEVDDFYKILKVYVKEGTGVYRPIERINLQDVYGYRPVTSSLTFKILYIPWSSKLQDSDGNFNDDATFDGINGWEEHTLCLAAAKVKRKKEEDYRPYEQEAAKHQERMAFMGNTDFSGPARVVRKRTNRRADYFPYQTTVSGWTLRSKNITFYYAYPWVP